MEPIFLKPAFQEKIWGGNKLSTAFHLDIPSEQTGEAWVISAHPNGLSYVKSPAKYQGQSLSRLYEEVPQIFGPHHPEPFPLLVKILDAREDLSIQVHPNDDYAKEHEGPEELGKTECWYVISADEGASIVYGHHAKTVEEFKEYIYTGNLTNVFREIPVKAGDFFDVPAGTIHAIGGGITILETQQSSDTTYRVYDFDRVDGEGKLRELHLNQVEDVTLFPHRDSPYTNQALIIEKNQLVKLMSNEYFNVYKVEVDGQVDIPLELNYYLATVIDGEGLLVVDEKSYDLPLAESFILPYGTESVTLKGNFSLIISSPNY